VTSNLVHGFVWAMPSMRTNKFSCKWAWPRSRDPYNFGSTVGYPSDSLASCFSSREKGILKLGRSDVATCVFVSFMIRPDRSATIESIISDRSNSSFPPTYD